MLEVAYIDPGTTGLIAQIAAAGMTGAVLYFRSRFGKGDKDEAADDVREPGGEVANRPRPGLVDDSP